MARPSSEISIKRVTLAFSGEQPAGGFVALDGAALDRCVRADTIATLKEVDRAERAAFLARSAALSDLERPRVEPDQFFLSKVGVLPEFRGTGYGRALCERFLAIGSAAGFERFRLDVSPTNVPAVRLYESLGFRVVADAASEQTGIRALSMVLERLRQRDG
jgi:ribosomal protein S18 acetylase RimI-like enzyme